MVVTVGATTMLVAVDPVLHMYELLEGLFMEAERVETSPWHRKAFPDMYAKSGGSEFTEKVAVSAQDPEEAITVYVVVVEAAGVIEMFAVLAPVFQA